MRKQIPGKLVKVRSEWTLVTLAYNPKRLFPMGANLAAAEASRRLERAKRPLALWTAPLFSACDIFRLLVRFQVRQAARSLSDFPNPARFA